MITNHNLEFDTQGHKKDYYFDTKKEIIPPPFIGCLLSDKDGKTLVSFEVFKGALDFFIKRGMKEESRRETFNVELIPMFICALERFSEEINIQNVPCLNLKGNNIKLHSIFNLDFFTITFFLNPLTNINLYENLIHNYFLELVEENKIELNDIKKLSSLDFINHLEELGMEWINHLNNLYLEKL